MAFVKVICCSERFVACQANAEQNKHRQGQQDDFFGV